MISALAIAAQLPGWQPCCSGRRGVKMRCVRLFGRHRVIWERAGRGGIARSTRDALAQASAAPARRPQLIPTQLNFNF